MSSIDLITKEVTFPVGSYDKEHDAMEMLKEKINEIIASINLHDTMIDLIIKALPAGISERIVKPRSDVRDKVLKILGKYVSAYSGKVEDFEPKFVDAILQVFKGALPEKIKLDQTVEPEARGWNRAIKKIEERLT